MLWKVIVFGIPVFIAFAASTFVFAKEKTLIALVQLIGAVCLLVMIFTHIAEAFDLFPSMGWGQPNSPGHYIDLVSAITGIILLAVGYFSRRFLREKLLPEIPSELSGIGESSRALSLPTVKAKCLNLARPKNRAARAD